jgi:hypothetical protein
MNQYEYRYIFKLFPPDFLIYPMSARTWPATTIASGGMQKMLDPWKNDGYDSIMQWRLTFFGMVGVT